MSALLAPGTIVNRALSAALCTVFSFNSTICTVNLVNSSDRVVAATPPAVERNISDWLVQRDPGEFDDAPSAPSGSNPQVPPFPQDPGPNQPLRPDFDRAIDSASENAAQDSAAELQQISNAIDQYASEASESAACNFLGKNSRNRISLQRKPNNQSPTEQKICKYDGRYAVFAKHPIPSLSLLDTIPYASDAVNIEPVHEQIFFCENGKITRNVGFGPEGRFSYTNRAIAEGIDETISDVHRNPIRAKNERVDDFTPIDQLYDAELMDRVLDRSNVCTLIDGPGSYGQPLITGLFNNCQGFAQRMRNQFDQKLQSICEKPQQTTQQPRGQLKTASSWGDPHLTSFDGQKYDHHAIGEFVLTRSKDKHFEVQVREAPYGSSSSLAINIAAAMRVGNDRVAIYSQDFPDNNTQDPLRVNGKTISGEKQNLSGGGFVARTGSGSYLVQWPSGEQVTVKIFNKLVEVTPGVSEGDRGQLEGLLGNFNGNPSDDFMTRDGRVIAENKEAMNIARSVLSNFDVSHWIPIPIDPLTEAFLDSIHRQFGDSWRISQTESLFDYAAGKNTDSFTNKSFPNGFVILRMLAPQAVQLAEETCRKAEVPNERLEGCLFDVAASGDVSLANVAANILKNEVNQRVEQEIRNRVPVPIPLPF